MLWRLIESSASLVRKNKYMCANSIRVYNNVHVFLLFCECLNVFQTLYECVYVYVYVDIQL